MSRVQSLIDAGGGVIHGAHDIPGGLYTTSDTRIEWAPGAVLRQTGPSETGAFLSNVTPTEEDREQSSIELVNPQIDGSGTLAPQDIVISGATSTTINMPGSHAGKVVQVMNGAAVSGVAWRTIVSHSGGIATVSPAFSSVPSSGDTVRVGWNDSAIGFAWGVDRLRIYGGHLRGYPGDMQVPPSWGGKGVNCEQGVSDALIDGATIEGFNHALFASGTAGAFTNGTERSALGIRFVNVHAIDAGALLTVANLDMASGIPSAGDQTRVMARGLTYQNAGHAPYRIVKTGQQKSGVINLLGATGVFIDGVMGHNAANYPLAYPTDYSAYCGYGLSGPIGAMVAGHARNTTIRDFRHFGAVDAVVHVGRGRAVGDDAPPTGRVTQMRGWNMSLEHHGSAGAIVSEDCQFGVDWSELSGEWNITADAVSQGFFPASMATCTGLCVSLTERLTGKTIKGSPASIMAVGNNFSNFANQYTDLR